MPLKMKAATARKALNTQWPSSLNVMRTAYRELTQLQIMHAENALQSLITLSCSCLFQASFEENYSPIKTDNRLTIACYALTDIFTQLRFGRTFRNISKTARRMCLIFQQ